MSEYLSYAGKRVIVSGCYSGMGEATARLLLELGAEVHGLDYQDCKLPLASFQRMDLREPNSIDAALSSLRGSFDALFNCAGVPSTFAQVDMLRVNYVGPRRLTDGLLPRLTRGAAIACISSSAGLGWARRLDLLKEFVAIESYQEAVAWVQEKSPSQDMYTFSKEAIIVWTLTSSSALIGRGIRMNCTLPGPTQTPFMEKQTTITPAAQVDAFTWPINRRSVAEEQAAALVFLNSSVASYVNGVALPVDGGFIAGVSTGVVDVRSLLAERAKA